MAAKRRNRIIWIRADELKIHPTAQRALVRAQLEKRMRDLDFDLIGVLAGVAITETFSFADDDGQTWTLEPGVYIIDGQHRVKALISHGFGEWKVQVELHQDAVDPVRASEVFLGLQARAIVDAFTKFEQSYRARNTTALAIKTLIEKHGYRLGRSGKIGQFGAVGAGERIYILDQGESLDKTLWIVSSAFGQTASAVEGKLLEGIASVVCAHNGALDFAVLIKKLAKYPGGAPAVLGDAKGLRRVRRMASLSVCVAEIVVETYNQGRRGDARISLP